MEYVGWKDIHSAMRYIDAPDPFSQKRIEQSLKTIPVLEAEYVEINLQLSLMIERFHKRVKGMKKTRGLIEQVCLSSLKMKVLSNDRQMYQITVSHETADQLDEIIDHLLHQMHEIANNNQCMLETYIKDPGSGRIWD